MENKEVLNKYWVSCINQLLTKLSIEPIDLNEFSNCIVTNTKNHNSILTIICTGKMLVLSVNDSKITGGWKYF